MTRLDSTIRVTVTFRVQSGLVLEKVTVIERVDSEGCLWGARLKARIGRGR